MIHFCSQDDRHSDAAANKAHATIDTENNQQSPGDEI